MRPVVFLILSLLGLQVLPADPIYSVVNLGGLGGGMALGYRINNAGETVGWAQTATGDTHPFRAFVGSAIEDLAGPGVSDGFAYGVNDSGQIAVSAYINGIPHGLILGAAGTTDLGPDTFALAVNSNGQAAGGNGHAILYANAHVQDLGTLPGGDWSAAYDINSSDAIAGSGDIGSGVFRGFVWTPASGMTPIGTFGGNNSHATAISDSGEVAGFATLSTGYEHAFVYLGGKLIDLGTLGGSSSFAYDVSDSGAAVGYSWLADGPNPHAFLYSDGILVDLNSLIPANSGWELLGAYGINHAGQIVGEGLYQGQDQAFLLNPTPVPGLRLAGAAFELTSIDTGVPEPGTFLLLVSGVGLIVVRYLPIKWKRKRQGIPAE